MKKGNILEMLDEISEAWRQIQEVNASLKELDDATLLEAREVILHRTNAAMALMHDHLPANIVEHEAHDPEHVLRVMALDGRPKG